MKDLKQIGESLEELQQQYPQHKALLVISEKVCSLNCSNILISFILNLRQKIVVKYPVMAALSD